MNLEPETRRGYYISAEMKKVWAVEMELLKKLLEVCKKHNFKIWAEGGTLLGAVREHGYIPWDDDIDMAMPREDYDKLQAIAKDEFKAPYFFQSGYTDLFYKGMSKLRMDGTAAILPNLIPIKCHQGIFIDIFPMDVMPDNETIRLDFIQQMEIRRRELEMYCRNSYSLLSLKHNWILLKLRRYVNSLGGFSAYFKLYDDYCKQHSLNKGGKISLISWKWSPLYFRERNWYSHTVELPFEDILIPVPSDYNKILSLQYGDYLRPVKAPSLHGSFAILDPRTSYQSYIPALKKKYKELVWNTRKERLKKLLRFSS